MLFPHLYGPLPVRAVLKAVGYPPAPDGSFPPIRPTPADDLGVKQGVGFNLHQQLGRDQRGDLDHGGDRTDLAENLSVHLADLAPASNIRHIDAGPDHVGERRASVSKRNLDAAQSISGLCG